MVRFIVNIVVIVAFIVIIVARVGFIVIIVVVAAAVIVGVIFFPFLLLFFVCFSVAKKIKNNILNLLHHLLSQVDVGSFCFFCNPTDDLLVTTAPSRRSSSD